MPRVTPFHVAWYAVRVLVTQAVVDPVREGGPRPWRWPRPVRAVAALLAVIYAVLMSASLFSAYAPEPPAQALTLSPPGRWLVALGTSAVLYAAYVGGVHLAWWARALIGVAVGLPVVAALSASFLVGSALGPRGPLVFFLVLVPLQVASWVALVVLALRQRRRAITHRWLAATAVAFAVAYVLPHVVALVLDDGTHPTVQVMTFLTVTILTFAAMPMAIAAGVAFSEVSLRVTSWTWTTVRPLVPGWFWPAAVAALVVAHGVLFAREVGVRGVATREFGVAVAAAAACCVAIQLAIALARRRLPVEATRPLDLAARVPPIALSVGAVSAIALAATAFVRDRSAANQLQFVAAGAFLVLVCAHAVWRGRPAAAGLSAAYAMGYLLLVPGLTAEGIVRDSASDPVLVLLLLAALGWWAVRRRLTPLRWLVVTLGLSLPLVFAQRQLVADPVNALVQGTSGALLVGLLWRAITDAGFTHRGTRRFPVDARAMLFASWMLIAATGTVVVTYGGKANSAYDLEVIENMGNVVMGRFTLFAAVVGLVEAGRFHVDPDPDAPLPPAELER